MVFYFTGTGNSLFIAKELEAAPISIPQTIHWKELAFRADQIGIVCPIYGHEIPAMVKDFIRKATFETPYLYAVLTYGNAHGGAAEIAREEFKAAGKNADYITTIQMVDNFLPGFDMDKQCKLDKRVGQQLVVVKADVRQKKHGVQKASFKDRTVHKLYREAVHCQLETLWAAYRVTDACIGCGICTRVCPAGCIHLKSQRAVHTKAGCQACMACIHACPKLAIMLETPMKEPNPKARYRNEHITLAELVAANEQTGPKAS